MLLHRSPSCLAALSLVGVDDDLGGKGGLILVKVCLSDLLNGCVDDVLRQLGVAFDVELGVTARRQHGQVSDLARRGMRLHPQHIVCVTFILVVVVVWC